MPRDPSTGSGWGRGNIPPPIDGLTFAAAEGMIYMYITLGDDADEEHDSNPASCGDR